MGNGSTDNQYPSVSLILPIRNEAKSIRATLQSIFGQDYPPDRIEILIVDGMSTDNTREVIRNIEGKNPSVKLEILDNERQIVAPALNIGVQHSVGQFILRVDGHCELPPDYVRIIVEILQSRDIQNVGGQQYPVGQTYLERAIAMATTSPFFIGNSYFRYAVEERLVDTVFLGAYPREVFDEIGLFDEELIRHQDYDFNLRLRNEGGKILYLPYLKVKYQPRSTIQSFFKQYFQYGVWKVRVMQKSRHAFRLRHYAPTALVIAGLLGALISIFLPGFIYLYLICALLYILISFTASILICKQDKVWRYLPVLPIIFMSIHFGWGSGFWWGVIKWNLLEKNYAFYDT